MDGLPPGVAASSGFDALAHAIETAASAVATPHVLALSGVAIRLLLDALPRVAAPASDDVDPIDRERTAYAALLMGLNLAASTTCLPHRLQYPVGASTGSGHAEGVAALMPAWLARTAAVAPDRLAAIATAAGLAGEDDAAAEAAGRLVARVLELLDTIGMRRRLRDLGLGEGDVDGLVAAVEGTLSNDPGPTSPADLRDLYVASL
jgi:alcohol dehydrogenase class IV